MNVHTPIRLSPAEQGLISQLEDAGAETLAARLRASGLPTRRVEAYHYTDLKMLLDAVPPRAGKAIVGAPALRVNGAHRVLVANGIVEDMGTAPNGVEIGTSAAPVLSERDDVLVSLDRVMQGEALDLTLTGHVETVIHIDRRLEGEAGHIASAANITVADGAKATIIETLSGSEAAHLSHGGTKVSVGAGAEVTHILVDRASAQATQFSTLEYALAEDANLTSLVVHAGAALARTQVFAAFQGERAHADFRGLNLVNEEQHADITLDISHGVPNTTSTERYQQVGRGRSKAIFQGKITVAEKAQKTDAQMMTQGLMLSDTAEILAKPELVIYADDVVCGHGATCGDLDDTALFYLLSRGIPRHEAETMLVRAFLAEAFDTVETEAVLEVLDGVVDDWLGRAALKDGL